MTAQTHILVQTCEARLHAARQQLIIASKAFHEAAAHGSGSDLLQFDNQISAINLMLTNLVAEIWILKDEQ